MTSYFQRLHVASKRKLLGLMGKHYRRENSYPLRFAKEFHREILATAISRWQTPARSGVFENQDVAIAKWDLWGASMPEIQLGVVVAP
ncbi:MAG: hypothetical protein DVB25_01985 [Verrucomicrobia bacterium]|nr:MAG: hypothetical protein DVB25_01985 [Verrucomicrobiota bacterium]